MKKKIFVVYVVYREQTNMHIRFTGREKLFLTVRLCMPSVRKKNAGALMLHLPIKSAKHFFAPFDE